jgi:cation transport protein ChaC
MSSHDIWIFGYGSLMWRPDFAYAERRGALLAGYHRCFCITSTHHRGSAERPGLVLGLDRGRSCQGVAYRVSKETADGVMAALRKRELVNGVYREALAPVQLDDEERRHVFAIAYIVERAHPSYAGHLPLAVQAHQIRGARGLSGDNLDYLINTVRHLQMLGIRERELERLVGLSAAFVAQRGAHSGNGAQLVSHSAGAIRRAVSRMPDSAPRMRRWERRRFLYRMRLGGRGVDG